jgi:hypothetical protein
MSPRTAQIRIYVDADVLGLGKILAGLRNDVTYPGDPGVLIHRKQISGRARCDTGRSPVTQNDQLHAPRTQKAEVATRLYRLVTGKSHRDRDPAARNRLGW